LESADLDTVTFEEKELQQPADAAARSPQPGTA
jgi:hypothetical protein